MNNNIIKDLEKLFKKYPEFEFYVLFQDEKDLQSKGSAKMNAQKALWMIEQMKMVMINNNLLKSEVTRV